MTPLPQQPSLLLVAGFVVLSLLLVATLALTIRSWKFAVGGAVWMIATGLLGSSGWLADFAAMPPRMVLLLVPTFAMVGLIAFSRFGDKIAQMPLALLVGVMVFRIPVELLIHLAVDEGVAPPQMTWSGMNFDILAAVSAGILALFVTRLPRWSVVVWNILALGLLIWVVGIAALSTPSPVQKIEPDNIWIAYFPFIWLPTVAVAFAFLGHLVIFRKLFPAN